MILVIFKMSHLFVLSKNILHHYVIHDHSGVGDLFQLRVGLCSFRYHKKHHNFVDTPSNECSCNCGIEETNHFLFLCPFYEAQRATLVTSVIGILQKIQPKSFRKTNQTYIYMVTEK